MTIRFACPSCKQQMDANESKAGSKLFCPKCGQKIKIPQPPPDPRKKTMLGELVGVQDARNKTVLAAAVPAPSAVPVTPAAPASAAKPAPKPAGPMKLKDG